MTSTHEPRAARRHHAERIRARQVEILAHGTWSKQRAATYHPAAAAKLIAWSRTIRLEQRNPGWRPPSHRAEPIAAARRAPAPDKHSAPERLTTRHRGASPVTGCHILLRELHHIFDDAAHDEANPIEAAALRHKARICWHRSWPDLDRFGGTD